MLSAQCDELRKAAQTCRDLGRYETEQMLLDAADTILSLRDKAQALQAESTKLRELVKEMRVCLEDECKRCHEWGDACDLEHQMRDLGIEAGDGVS